jgi:hypothetical protein
MALFLPFALFAWYEVDATYRVEFLGSAIVSVIGVAFVSLQNIPRNSCQLHVGKGISSFSSCCTAIS